MDMADELFTRRVLQLLVDDFHQDWCAALQKPMDPDSILALASRAAGVVPRDMDDAITFQTRTIAALLVRAGPLWASFCNEAHPVVILKAVRSIVRCPALSDMEKRRVLMNCQSMSGLDGASKLLAMIQQRGITLLRAVSSGVSMAPRHEAGSVVE